MILDEMNVKCPCCGENIVITVRHSFFVADRGIDLRPTNTGALPKFYHCPKCNFCDIDFDKGSDPAVRAMVATDLYQNIWKQDNKTEEEKMYLSAIQSATTARLAADFAINYCWYLEFEGKTNEARSARENAVAIQKDALEENKEDYELMLQRMDCLRQLGRMQEALDMIPMVKPLVSPQTMPEFVKLLVQEKKYIQAGDTTPHLISEVLN